MTSPRNRANEPRLEVYLGRSILVSPSGAREEFREGMPSGAAKRRLEKIRAAFEKGFLEGVVQDCRRPDAIPESIAPKHLAILTRLVDSVTSEVGRAIVGLSVLQMTIKAICPEQSVRLHKGGGRGESFSWADGIPMRVLDTNYCTPILRKYNLLRINAFGVFMTRSLAENYPYSKLYKAAMRGAREEWLELVDLIEARELDPLLGLRHLIAMLFNRSDAFKELAEDCVAAAISAAQKVSSLDEAIRFMHGFVDSSTYSARVFEISMHSFFQVLEDAHAFSGCLKPLSQMRSANKKHGNIGDIEIGPRPGSLQINEAWDAKYGKPYLREELEELAEKLIDHPETKVAGFVTDSEPNLKKEIVERIKEIEQASSATVPVVRFDQWIARQAERAGLDETRLAQNWVIAFAESLCQLRRNRAPIDEPSDAWVAELKAYCLKWRRRSGRGT